jgi:predicted CXXCH cytochrome family protein
MNYSIVNIIITFILITLTMGCNEYSRHDILTFFFTGVPPIAGEEEEVDLTVSEKTEEVKSTNWPSIHGPYDANECNQCHKVESNVIGATLGAIPSFQDLPRELLLPENELCIECHTTKSFASAFTRDLWIHGPISTGMCRACHHHHKSGYPYLLLKETSIELCSQCHIEGLISGIDEHLRGEECTVCHNPHVGKNRFLLKKEYFEVF